MKKLLLIMMILLLITGCQKKKDEAKYMKDVSFEDNKCTFNLDYSDGTGFEWNVVYKTDNLEIDDFGYHVFRDDPTESGGHGVYHAECHITDDEEAVVLFKYARPWEGYGDFQTYVIKSENGKIADITGRYEREHSDFEFIHMKIKEGYFSMYIPKGWEYEEVQEGEQSGFKVRPQDKEGYLWITHDPDYKFSPEGLKVSHLDISGRPFMLAYRNEKFSFFYGMDEICCDGNEAPWAADYFLDILKIVDSTVYDNGE